MWENTATKKKSYGRNTVASNSVFFFLNYETKFSISLIFLKISKDNLKKQKNKKN